MRRNMADKGGGSSRNSPVNYPIKGRNVTKLPKSPLHRLYMRELGGIHQHHRRSVNTQIFHKLPGRLGFNLRNLVDESVLQEGHVFLGFSKNGQFLLSYTLHVEADEHTAHPVYVYRLQWWQFIPYKRLRKVAEVRLFGEEDIQQDLYIAVCEWPTDNTRVLIYGYCAPISEEKHLCYLTILAVPPVAPCEDCNQLVILHAQSGYHVNLYDAPPRCLNHAFAVHTKYELAPPYPSFAPKIFLKLDGVLIINTGDSLLALSVDIEDNHGGFGFGLYSPRVARSMSNISTASSSPYDDHMSYDSQDHSSELELDPVLGVLGQSPCSNLAHAGRSSLVPKEPAPDSRVPLRERHASTGKENHLGSPHSPFDASQFSPNLRHDSSSPSYNNNHKHEMSPSYHKHEMSPSYHKHEMSPSYSSHKLDSSSSAYKPSKSALDVYNFEGTTPKKDELDSGDYLPSCSQPTRVRATLSFSGLPQSASLGSEPRHAGSSIDSEGFCLMQSDSLDSSPLEDLDRHGDSMDVFQKPTNVVRLRDPLGIATPSRSLPGLTLIPPENLPLSKTISISPGCGRLDTGGSSTCSSCVSSPIILQSDSQCFTYSVRRYVEYFGRPESPVDVEDDLNLAYHSVLPLEVHGANYCNMRLLTKALTAPQMPCVVVKQLTLDIEHYLGETVRTTAEWGHRYLAFTDYDVQILEVCPETSEVIAMVFVLIRARPPKDKHVHHGHRALPKLYQSGFRLIWNLRTGSYTTLDVEDLVEINKSELLRKRWQPGHRISDGMQRRFAVPQVYSRSVHVLTNEAVFKGQSLKMLLDTHNYVAILL